MNKPGSKKHIWIDLNHPADFHFFRTLIREWKEEGWKVSLSARDKECLFALLEAEGWVFRKRGRGTRSRAGKYLHGIRVLLFLLWHMVRDRPGVTLSLSSPYLVLASRILGIPGICYDDTDINPRLMPFIRMAPVVVSPASYPIKFHDGHHRIPTFKEISYLAPGKFPQGNPGTGAFIRLTRTDSIHHSEEDRIDPEYIAGVLNRISGSVPMILSAEDATLPGLSGRIRMARILEVHEDLEGCRAFWGNSATMAAEAAILGIPAIFVGREIFSYLSELEAAGMLFIFPPSAIDLSFRKLEELLSDQGTRASFAGKRDELLKGRVDALDFITGQIHDHFE